ncbi:MAG: CHASE2 domain-containing protein [Bacteroidales bacterium]|nr:CHASE2 domain-containing protein [Bacteroidales bacterium]
MRIVKLLRHNRIRGIWIGFFCVGLVAIFSQFPIFTGLDDWLFDSRFTTRDDWEGGTRPSRSRNQIIIISIDEEDFDSLAKPIVFMSPELGAVIAHARHSGATAVGVDMMIPNSLSTVEAIIDSRKFGKATAVGKAVRDVGHVVLPVSFPPPPRKSRWPIDQWLLKYRDPDNRDPWGRDVGSIDLAEDADHFIRRAPIVRVGDERQVYPSFTLALAAWEADQPWRWDPDTKTVLLGEDTIPVAADGTIAINWVGPPGTFSTIPFRQVLAAAQAGEPVPELNGKIALIGTTDPAFQDYHATPYSNGYTSFRPSASGRMAGVEIHANTIATIRDRAFITTPTRLSPWPWLLVTGPLLGLVFARTNLIAGLIIAIGHHVGWKLLAAYALMTGNWRVDLIGMLSLGALTCAASFANRWLVLRRVLGAVKSQALAKALEENPSRLDLAGENRTVTVMFVDIRGFSTFSAEVRNEPAKVVTLLNAYFSAVIPGIEKSGGTVNQFMGDGMMILFNAPMEYPDHASRAIQAARGMIRAVRDHAAEFEKLGLPNLRIGVGINTGTCTVGAVGARTRLDYTAIGDVTNAAARLEAATKEVGAPILIGAGTYAALTPEEQKANALDFEPQELTLKGVGKLKVWPIQVES